MKIFGIHRLAVLILFLHLALGALYSVAVPIWEAYDEWGHYSYVQYIASNRSLPPRDQRIIQHHDTARSQPPLYYILGAAATFWIDTSDWQGPQENRYASLPTAMGGYNRTLHGYEEDYPWAGWALAVHIVRIVSVVLSTITVCLTYLIALALFPNRLEIAVGAAAINAFWPKFVFMGSVINNDNLIATFGALLMLFMVRNVLGPSSLGNYAGLVASQGLAVASKIVGIAFLPVTLFGLAWSVGRDARKYSAWKVILAAFVIVGGAISFGLIFLLSHPLYVKNLQLFLTPPAVLGQMSLNDWLGVIGLMWGTLWASFGWQNISIADWGYRIAELIWGVALLGLVWFFACGRDVRVKWALVGLMLSITAVAGLTMYRGLFSAYYFTGRYLLSTISAIATLLAAGLGSLGPRRWSRFVIGGVGLGMFVFAVYIPFAYIMPVYARPEKLSPEAVENLANPLHASFDGKIEWVGYEMKPTTFHPGETVRVSLYWKCLDEMEANYTLAVKIIGPDDREYASLNVHPGRGSYPTSMWRKGDIFEDVYWMPIAGDVPPLTMARLKVAFFRDQADLAHLPVYDQSGQDIGFAVFAGRFKVAPIQMEKYHPQQQVNYRLGDAISLVGYDLPRSRHPADSTQITLTLYWQAHGATERPYTVFAHITDERGKLIAQADGQPVEGNYPTDLWGDGEAISDTHTISLPVELPDGRYEVSVGLYSVETGQRLPVFDDQGQPAPVDQIELGQIALGVGILPTPQGR